jgi:hypothetical protein
MTDHVKLGDKFCSEQAKYNTAVFRPFRETNFKLVYDACKDYKACETTDEQRQDMLQSSLAQIGVDPQDIATNKRTGRSFVDKPDPDEQAIYLWTLQCHPTQPSSQQEAIYRQLNGALLIDDPTELRKFGYLMRAMNRYLVSHPSPEAKLLYRGTTANNSQRAPVDKSAGDEGIMCRQPMYIAASEDKATSSGFLKEGSPLLEFEVPEGCYNCTPIKHLSAFEEEEWLMPPYSPVEFVRQRMEDVEGNMIQIITFKVLDGLVVSHEQEASGLTIKSCLVLCELGMVPDAMQALAAEQFVADGGGGAGGAAAYPAAGFGAAAAAAPAAAFPAAGGGAAAAAAPAPPAPGAAVKAALQQDGTPDMRHRAEADRKMAALQAQMAQMRMQEQRVFAAVETQVRKTKGGEAVVAIREFHDRVSAFNAGHCTAAEFREALCELLTPEFTSGFVPVLAEILASDEKKAQLLAAHAALTCPAGHCMRFTAYRGGPYAAGGWICDNCAKHGTGERWCCVACTSDVCSTCAAAATA